METVHLMHGKEDDLNLRTTKTGCRLTGEHRDVKCYVFWGGRQHVTCDSCMMAIARLERLQGG